MTIVFHWYFDRNPKFSIELLGISIEILGFSFEILDISKICNNRIPEVFRSKSKVLDRNNRYFDRNTAQKKCYLASPPLPPVNQKKKNTKQVKPVWTDISLPGAVSFYPEVQYAVSFTKKPELPLITLL